MLHTIVPMEQIFTTEYAAAEMAEVGGAPAEVFSDAYGRKSLGRLYTTDLKEYLRLTQLFQGGEETMR